MNASVIPAKALLLLSATLLALFLAACGSDEGDLTPPSLTVNAVNPITTEPIRYLSGTKEAGSEVTVIVDRTATISQLVQEGETWSCVIGNLQPGANNVSVSATDDRGNTRTVIVPLAYNTFTLDLLTTPTSATTQNIRGSINPETVLTADWVKSTGNETACTPIVTFTQWSCDISPVVMGETNTLRLIGKDSRNKETTFTFSIKGDAAAPKITVDPPATPTQATTVNLTGTRSSIATVTILDAALNPIGTVAPQNPLPDPPNDTDPWSFELPSFVDPSEQKGQLIFYAKASDGTSESSAQISIIRDVVEPQVIGSKITLTTDLLTVPFSEAMDETSVVSALTVTDPSLNPVPFTTIEYDSVAREVLFTPTGAFASGVKYTVNVAASAADLAGNTLPALFTKTLTAP